MTTNAPHILLPPPRMLLFGQLLMVMSLLAGSFFLGAKLSSEHIDPDMPLDWLIFGAISVAVLQYLGHHRSESWACYVLWFVLLLVGIFLIFFVILMTVINPPVFLSRWWLPHVVTVLFGIMAIFIIMCSEMNYAWGNELYASNVKPLPRTQFSIQDICVATFAIFFSAGASKLWAEFWFPKVMESLP